ncbi:glycosyltransferase WbuB [Xylanimonas allomyrinae]|uniref:Glycosyltransferase WbuB n=1 Tax=Xylanimonas allomyrinae TaxID=2509459 RepID=A0A4V0YEB3_9MICO|nr:glycosyltransferase [Xylanimonas allomyrinae]QAY63611.1 glycosyltransferase WbuB [Xylanimonas allomyrinae]
MLLVTHHFAPEGGAPARRWESLIERLTAFGFEFAVLAPPPHDATGRVTDPRPEYRRGHASRGPCGELILRTGYRRHSASLPSRTHDQVVAALSSVAIGVRRFHRRDARPHVVIGTVPGIPSMFAGWALARILGARFVIEMRDAWPDLIDSSGMLGTTSRLGVRRRLRVLVTHVAHRTISRLQTHADLVVTTTETFAAVLRDRGQEAVTVVRNGTRPPAVLTLDPDAPPRGRPGVDRPLRALYLGTVGRAQCLDTVVQAARLVADRGYRLEVRIVGRGAHAARVHRLARQLGAPVTVEPPVPHHQAIELYRWADTAIVALHGWGRSSGPSRRRCTRSWRAAPR